MIDCSHPTPWWRRRRFAVVATLVATTALGGGVARALFTASADATVELTVARPFIPRPATVNCQTGGFITSHAAVSWTAPIGYPQPTQYVVRVQNGGVEQELARFAGTQTSGQIGGNLLTGSLAWLLTLLVGGGTRPITINTIYGTGSNQYESASAWTHHIRGELLGIGCGSGATPSGARVAQTTTTTTTTTAVAETTTSTSTTSPGAAPTTLPGPGVTTTGAPSTTPATGSPGDTTSAPSTIAEPPASSPATSAAPSAVAPTATLSGEPATLSVGPAEPGATGGVDAPAGLGR